MRRLRKVISSFLALSMILTLIVPNVLATDTSDTSTSRGKINMVYLGTGTGSSTDTLSPQAIPDTSEWTADPTKGTVFWVGLTLSDLKTMDTTATNDSDRTSHFSNYANDGVYDWVGAGGIFNIATGLEYASEYIKPVYVSDSQMKNSNYEPAVMKKLDTRYSNYTWDVTNIAANVADDDTGREVAEIKASDNPKMVYVSITTTGDITSNIFGFTDDLNNDPIYILAVPFRLIKKPAEGTKVVQAALNPSNFVLQTGSSTDPFWGAQWNVDRTITPTLNLKNHLDYTGSLDLFPAGAATKTGISVKSGSLKTPQYVGGTFTSGVTLQFDYSDNSHKDLGTSDTVTYKYGAAGITAATSSSLTEVPTTLTSAVNGQHIYAIVGNYIYDLGALTVSDVKTTKVEVVSGAPTTAYDDTAIDFKDLVAKITKNNGDTVTDIKFTNFENASNDLAIYKSDAAGTVNAQVTAADKYAHGDNYFVVALKSDPTVKSAPFKVTSDYDDITISASTNNAAKTSYNKDDNFDPTGIVVSAKKASETTGTDVAYANFDGNYKVVIATSDTEAKTATAVTASTKITEAMLDGTHKVYVVYTNADSNTQSVVSVATLGAKKIARATVSGGKTAYTYGDKLKTDDLKLNVIYDDNSTGEISFADLAAAGITVKIGDTVVNADTVITPDMKDKTVDFIYDGKTLTSSAKITVAAKTVYYTVSDATITKVYDGGLTIPADQTLPTISIKDSATAFVGSDSYEVTGTFAYTDKNVGTDKKIKLTAKLPETNGKYTFAPDTDKINADGTLKTNATITTKALTIKDGAITVPAVKANPNATADVTADSSLVLTKDNSSVVDGDSVTLPFTYKYAANDVKAPGTPDVTVTEKALTGADKDNYSFTPATVTVKGSVTQEAFSDIEISGPTKLTYTYPELTPDLSDLVVNAVYGSGASATKTPVTNYKLLDKDGNEFNKDANLPYGDTVVTVSYTESGVTKTKTFTLTAKKKQIKLSDITFTPDSKVYDDSTAATGTATVKDGVLSTGDENAKITAKWEFDGKDVGTNTIKVSEITIDNENYEIIDDTTNLPTSTTTITNSTAVIKPATPENVTAVVDKKTNNVSLNGTSEDFEYSTDNGATWTKTAPTIENTTRDTEYTVLVRKAATDSAPASDPVTVKATTYKYLVNVYKKGSTTPEISVYTNDTELESVKDDATFGQFNTTVLGGAPSRFSKYFTDAECTTAATLPLTFDSDKNVDLYYTQRSSSGGGGGGGASTYIVTFKAGTHGDFAANAAKTQNVSKNASPKTTPEIVAKDGYKFIGWSEDGKTVTDVTKYVVTKAVTFTALYEEVEPEATATPAPTKEPVIDTEYTKPYASGYDDGSFQPNNNITRGELAAMIARLSYGDDLPNGVYQASFPDVDSDAWFNKYIGYLEDKDVLSGYEDGTFRPMDTITRGEISAVIARAQRYDLISYNDIFTDVTENDWAKDYIETLADKNIVSGYEDGTFGPYSPLTRAEAVAIINRVLVQSTPIVTFTPNDITGHWAEADILLAVNERIVGANAVVPPVTPEETVAPEETTVPEETVAPEETAAPTETPAA